MAACSYAARACTLLALRVISEASKEQVVLNCIESSYWLQLLLRVQNQASVALSLFISACSYAARGRGVCGAGQPSTILPTVQSSPAFTLTSYNIFYNYSSIHVTSQSDKTHTNVQARASPSDPDGCAKNGIGGERESLSIVP